MDFGQTTSSCVILCLRYSVPASAMVVIVLPVPMSMRKAQPLLSIAVTAFHLLHGQRHVQLPVLPVRHDQQILRPVV